MANATVSTAEVKLLVDSGACASFISPHIFNLISKEVDLELGPVDSDFELADGSPLPVYGQFTSDVQLGPFRTEHPFVVADLGSLQGILGLDFMEDHDIQTRFAKGYIKVEVDGSEIVIPLTRINSHRCSRIGRNKTITIPRRSVKMVQMTIPRSTNIKEGMIEPSASLIRSGLVMARSLVKVENNSVWVNIMNVHDEDLILHRDRPLGILYPMSRLVGLIKATPKEDEPEENEDHLLTKDDLPEHIRPVLDDTELTPEQESKVVRMIQKYLHVFPGPGGNWD